MSEPRTYKVSGVTPDDQRVYKGFNRRMNGQPRYIAVVQLEGDTDVFALDTPVASSLQELERYLHDGQEQYTIIGVYCR